jgi:hypothetical protein
MDHLALLTFAYCVIFTFFNFLVLFLYYLYGFTFDLELRKTEKRIILPPFVAFLFHFKGVTGDSRTRPSRSGGGSEIFAITYFILAEVLIPVIGRAINDLVVACRISVVLCAAALIVLAVLTVKTKSKIRKMDKAESEQELKDYLTPKETIDIDNSEVIDDFLVEPHEKPPEELVDQLTNIGNIDNPNRKTVDFSEGLGEVSDMQSHPFDESAARHIVDEFDDQKPGRETIDVAEGMEAVDEIKKNLFEGDYN